MQVIRLLVLTLSLSLIGVSHAQDPVEFETARKKANLEGIEEAKADFAKKIYRLQVFGLRSASPSPSENYLKEHYGISSWSVAGCMVSAEIVGRADGYNSTMKRLLRNLYQRDIFTEAEAATQKTAP